jgi:hypothetical protein
MQIQIRTWMCGPTVACNCAVAVREDNNVLGINGCDLNGEALTINYLDANTGGASIQVSNDGFTYTVSFEKTRTTSFHFYYEHANIVLIADIFH